MADQTLEVNTAVEDHVEKPDPGEQEVSGPATDDEPTGTQCRDPPENTHPAAAESGWSAPILSLARKATETISSGMSYAAAPRKASQDSAVASAGEKEAENDLNSTAEKLPVAPTKDPMAIERSNLLSMMKLSIKVLIQSSLSLGRTLDSEYPPLQQFFLVLEHCLKHGLKAKKSFIGQNKSIWGPLELVEKLCPESANIATSARDLPGIRTGLGRARAWLHLALMQKKVADYLKALLDRKDLLRFVKSRRKNFCCRMKSEYKRVTLCQFQSPSEFYDAGALMLEEEGAVMGGLLVGLNVIDANLCIKGEDLDSQVAVIDFSLYLKDATSSETPKDDRKMTAILDQKHYIEELNRHLSGTVTNLQAKMDSLEKTNSKLMEELTAATDRINSLQGEQEQLRQENDSILLTSQKKEEAVLQDSQVELETYKQTRQGLDEMYNVVWKQYKEEKRIRQELERELELQVGLKKEMEVAMKLLEKDIHEKQDTLAALRLQLDQVKTLNLQMFHKAEVGMADSGRQAEKKQAEAAQLEQRINEMEKAMVELEERLQKSEQQSRQTDQSDKDMRVELEAKVDAFQKQLTDLDTLRTGLENELRAEREQRQSLQKALQREQDNSTELRTQLQQLQGLHTELQDLKTEKKQLQQRCEQQEQTLQEMGLHLSQSKLKMEDFKEVNKALKGHAWMKDDEATQCKQCQKEFSISRRKHHCRNCGDIYCNTCSSNELALPSYPRPVRVCDVCHSLLLQRATSTHSVIGASSAHHVVTAPARGPVVGTRSLHPHRLPLGFVVGPHLSTAALEYLNLYPVKQTARRPPPYSSPGCPPAICNTPELYGRTRCVMRREGSRCSKQKGAGTDLSPVNTRIVNRSMQDAVAGTAMLTDGFEDEIDSVTPRSPVAGMGVGATPGGVGLGGIGIGVGGKKVRLYGEPGGPAAERLDFKLAAAAVLSSGPGSGSDEDEVSEVESFILDQEDLDNPIMKTASELLLSSATDGVDLRTVDPETQARLEALLEAAVRFVSGLMEHGIMQHCLSLTCCCTLPL
ncbi:hypothetical protein CCH79_00005924 [Gambusia affinis]|uniref:FYVE-type domain-containing protein n=1 Tax=Gambusia affinis TaxID=33528 RepID=A0A315VKV5_GAMAF|nr:hypothetical protein CCH79_00005924 [Gambusia affinis]